MTNMAYLWENENVTLQFEETYHLCCGDVMHVFLINDVLLHRPDLWTAIRAITHRDAAALLLHRQVSLNFFIGILVYMLMGGAGESPSRAPRGQSVANIVAFSLVEFKRKYIQEFQGLNQSATWLSTHSQWYLDDKKSPSAPLCGLQAASTLYMRLMGKQ